MILFEGNRNETYTCIYPAQTINEANSRQVANFKINELAQKASKK